MARISRQRRETAEGREHLGNRQDARDGSHFHPVSTPIPPGDRAPLTKSMMAGRGKGEQYPAKALAHSRQLVVLAYFTVHHPPATPSPQVTGERPPSSTPRNPSPRAFARATPPLTEGSFQLPLFPSAPDTPDAERKTGHRIPFHFPAAYPEAYSETYPEAHQERHGPLPPLPRRRRTAAGDAVTTGKTVRHRPPPYRSMGAMFRYAFPSSAAIAGAPKAAVDSAPAARAVCAAPAAAPFGGARA